MSSKVLLLNSTAVAQILAIFSVFVREHHSRPKSFRYDLYDVNVICVRIRAIRMLDRISNRRMWGKNEE